MDPHDIHLAVSYNNLAVLLANMRRRAEAEPLYRKTLDIMEWAYGPSHLDVASCLYNLGGCAVEQGCLHHAGVRSPLPAGAGRVHVTGMVGRCLDGHVSWALPPDTPRVLKGIVSLAYRQYVQRLCHVTTAIQCVVQCGITWHTHTGSLFADGVNASPCRHSPVGHGLPDRGRHQPAAVL